MSAPAGGLARFAAREYRPVELAGGEWGVVWTSPEGHEATLRGAAGPLAYPSREAAEAAIRDTFAHQRATVIGQATEVLLRANGVVRYRAARSRRWRLEVTRGRGWETVCEARDAHQAADLAWLHYTGQPLEEFMRVFDSPAAPRPIQLAMF